MPEPYRVLAVCQANLCRSPMAERLLRTAFDSRSGLRVDSAGTHAREGLPMHPYTVEALRWNGIPETDFASRRLTAPLLAEADLVLTASRAQRAECARLAPHAVKHTFTLLQFARLTTAMPRADLAGAKDVGERLAAIVEAIPYLRVHAPAALPADDDLRDPVGGPLTAFRQCAERIRGAVRQLARVTVPR